MTLTVSRPSAATVPAESGSVPAAGSRRHDLDALRAVAMLLGIVLHAAISFSTIPWSVTDSRTHMAFTVLFSVIHGFRMPLFFLLSGFFTAMLWRRRTLKGLLRQRVARILLPLIGGCLTIVPAMWFVSSLATRPSPGAKQGAPLFAAVVSGDVAAVRTLLLDDATDVDAADSASGSTPLATAVFLGRTEIVTLLLNAGADVNLANRDRACPLHIAAFMGRGAAAGKLLQAGADVKAKDGTGQTPEQLLAIDFGTTAFIAGSLGVQLDEATLLSGRREVARQLGLSESVRQTPAPAGNSAVLYGLLFQMPVFMHLWFLSFLCWLVAGFACYTLIAERVPFARLPRWLFCSPASLLWLVPLTTIPQSFMSPAVFGPDSSIGLLPVPAVLGYYAVFFFFGAVYWEMGDTTAQFGRWWQLTLPFALLIVFPAGLDLTDGTLGLITPGSRPAGTLAANLLQALFAWLMISGSMGLFAQMFSRENRSLRYLSDASYWLYLVHLPLVIFAQWVIREWQLPASIKYVLLVVVVFSLLLLSYQFAVRYTVIGRVLNGPRCRTDAA